jgi:uncharacterized repeat protein (TIGR03847 family)
MATEKRYEFEEVTLLFPFAVGIPGNRTFFLAIGEKNNWVRIWVEKEHLQALAVAIEQLLLALSEEKISLPWETEGPPLTDETPTGLPSAELDIVQMTLGYDEGKAAIELEVLRSGAQEENPLEVHGRVTLAQLKKFGRQAAKICAAGRPLCPVCGGPIDPEGHTCPKEN